MSPFQYMFLIALSQVKLGNYYFLSNPVTESPDMDIHDAAKIMSKQQIRRLPIIQNNNLVCIVSLGDISIKPNLQDKAEQALKNISEPTKSHFQSIKSI